MTNEITSEIEGLLLKKVRVQFTPDRVIVGTLARNSFLNKTLCVRTGDVASYVCFFFELHEAQHIAAV